MNYYKHTQPGYVLFATYAVLLLILFFALSTVPDAERTQVSSATLILLAVAALLFGSLTVKVDETHVRLAFGIGLIRKKFAFSEIQSAEVVRNKWFYGFGIRYIGPKSWLFNVSGLDAVELKMKNGKTYRIGTDEPKVLHEAIKSRM